MRPTGLSAICIISLVLGVLGASGLLMGCFGLLMQPAMMRFVEQMQQNLPPQPGVQTQDPLAIHREAMAIQARWRGVLIAGFVLQAAAVSGLIFGGIQGLRLKRAAHKWLIAGMLIGILHAGVSAYAGYAMQRESRALVMRSMQTAPGGMPPPPAVRGMMTQIMQLSEAVALLQTFGWAAIKCGFFGVGIWYLSQRHIRRLLEPQEPLEIVFEA